MVGFLLGLPVEAGGADVLVVEVDRDEVLGILFLLLLSLGRWLPGRR